MGTGTTIWRGCVAAFQQNRVQGLSTRYVVPEAPTPSPGLHSAILRDAPAPAFVNATHAPRGRGLDNTLIPFSPPDPPRDPPAHSVNQSCPVCAMPASLLCSGCENQFCRTHLYPCPDCQTTLCGYCLDLHHLEGHWCDSYTVSAMLQLGVSRAERTLLAVACAEHSELAPVGNEHSELAATDAQLAPACFGHNHSPARTECNHLASAGAEPDHSLVESAHALPTVYPSCRRSVSSIGQALAAVPRLAILLLRSLFRNAGARSVEVRR